MSFRGGGRSINKRNGVVTVQVRPVTAKCPANQPALDRLLEIRIKAEQNPNSNYVFTIKRAIKSLADCKHPVTTMKEANELKYVGTTISKIIVPNSTNPTTKDDDAVPLDTTAPTTATATAKKRPKQTKVTSSFSSNNTTSTSSSSPPSSSTANKKKKAAILVAPSAKQKAYETSKRDADTLELPMAPWKVILIIDGREKESKQMVSRCKQSGIPCEERHLPIGDMAWIAQCNNNTVAKGGTGIPIEIMCGTIMERKETKDLASSLFGTRYLEQRLRLQHCGVPQVLFLVEGSLNSAPNCPAETLQMAMMETRVQLGFQVVQTKHMQDTVRLLKGLHRRIVQRTFPEAFGTTKLVPTFSSSPSEVTTSRPRRRRRPTSLLEMLFDTRPVPPFGTQRFITYSELKAKVEWDREAGTRTVGASYLAMLKQVATLSHKKCQAIATEYPTMKDLLNAYSYSSSSSSGDDPQPERMVQELPCDHQKVGPKSAAELFVACCTKRDGSSVTPKPTTSSTVPAAGAPRRSKPPPVAAAAADTAAATATTASKALLPNLSAASKPPPRRLTSTTSSSSSMTNSSSSSSRTRTASIESSTAAAASTINKPPAASWKKPPLQPRDVRHTVPTPSSSLSTADCVDLTEDSPLKPKSRPKAYNSAASPVGFDMDDYNDSDINLGMEESLRESKTPTLAAKRNLPPMEEAPKTPRGVAKRPPPPSSAYSSSKSTTSTTSSTFASPARTVTLDTPSGPLYESPPFSAPSTAPHTSTSSRVDQTLLVPPTAAGVRLSSETKSLDLTEDSPIKSKRRPKACNSAAASPVGFDVDDYNDFNIHLGMEVSLRESNTPTPAVKGNLPPMEGPPKTPRGVAKRPPPPSSAYSSSKSTTSTSASHTFASPARSVTLDTPSGPLYKSPPSSAPSPAPHTSTTSRVDQILLVAPAAAVRLLSETKALDLTEDSPIKSNSRPKAYNSAAAASPVGFDVDDCNDFNINLGMEGSLRKTNIPPPHAKRNLPPMEEPPKTPCGVAKRPLLPSSPYTSSESTTSTSHTFASPARSVTLDTPSGPLYESPPSCAPSTAPHTRATSRADQTLLVPPPAAAVRLLTENKAFQSAVVVNNNNSIQRKTYAKAPRQSLDTCGSNSPPLFTSPSTTGGGFLSSQSTLDESGTKTTDHHKNKNKNTSIVVIDDDSEDDVTPASRNDDVRVRLTKRLKRETIEIDD